MERTKGHQLQIIWGNIASPISIQAETKKRLINLLGDFLSSYWHESKKNNYHRQKGGKHDRKNID